jgi:hypothetical protein
MNEWDDENVIITGSSDGVVRVGCLIYHRIVVQCVYVHVHGNDLFYEKMSSILSRNKRSMHTIDLIRMIFNESTTNDLNLENILRLFDSSNESFVLFNIK